MALSLSIFKKKAGTGLIGLDVDGEYLAAVELADGRVVKAVSEELAPGLVGDGEVQDAAGLSEALRSFVSENSLPRRVRLGVANQQIVVRPLDLPPIENDKELDAAVRFQAAEAIAMPLEEAVIDYQVLPGGGGPGGQGKRVVVVAARESMISRLVEAVKGAGLRCEGIDLNAFALTRVLAREAIVREAGPDDAADQARVFCHLGGITNLAVALGDACLFTRPLSTTWEGDAESTAVPLAEEIRMSIDFYMAQSSGAGVQDVVLSGPGSNREGLPEEIARLISLPVSVADPFGKLDAAELPEREDPHRHTVAAGLALGATA